jgi:hypothetical protein
MTCFTEHYNRNVKEFFGSRSSGRATEHLKYQPEGRRS